MTRSSTPARDFLDEWLTKQRTAGTYQLVNLTTGRIIFSRCTQLYAEGFIETIRNCEPNNKDEYEIRSIQ